MDAPGLNIALRELEPGDIGAIHPLLSNMDVVRHMLFPLCSPRQTQEFIADAIQESASKPWRSVTRAIVDCAAAGLVGLCGLAILRGCSDGELWYLVAPGHWGRGIATGAARGMLKIGFAELDLHRIWATCLPENPASVRVLEKIGMRREGLQIKSLKIHGEWKNCYLYAILDEEWRSATPRATLRRAQST